MKVSTAGRGTSVQIRSRVPGRTTSTLTAPGSGRSVAAAPSHPRGCVSCLSRSPGLRAGFSRPPQARAGPVGPAAPTRRQLPSWGDAMNPERPLLPEGGTITLTHEADRATSAPEGSEAGRSVGSYRILSEVGHGGMGAVYLAVRDDDEFRKRVAIKLLRRGMATDDLVRRFRNERQILASIDHPHIAKLLDGGTTEEGFPYFLMEYVEGEPIDRYCDSHGLSVGERLELFRTVCAAVHFAHQNLVVHRDLKPGNILVTADGVVKLLDFGIAKLLRPELYSDRAGATRLEERLLTPEYASPEQARGEAITTASDVYSLGVLLYELLTGHLPYRLSGLSLHEVTRVIGEVDPRKPSTVIGDVEERTQADGTTAQAHPGIGQPDPRGAPRQAAAAPRRRPRRDRDEGDAQGAPAPLRLGRAALRGHPQTPRRPPRQRPEGHASPTTRPSSSAGTGSGWPWPRRRPSRSSPSAPCSPCSRRDSRGRETGRSGRRPRPRRSARSFRRPSPRRIRTKARAARSPWSRS